MQDQEEQEKMSKYINDMPELLTIRIDLFKHLSTLSSGAIVVAATFITELPAHAAAWLLALSLISFVLTIILAAWASFYTLGYILVFKQCAAGMMPIDALQKIEKGSGIGLLAPVCFVIGMLSLVAFSLSAI
jgi:uncharacterized membrane protein YdfJ with MMPL/SSD domain